MRETVINAVLHRDYRSSSDTVVKVFDDRIEVYNPGRLPAGLTVQKLLSGDYVSTPRNKQVAAMFKEAGIIEKYGSGISRIRTAMLTAGCPEPRFEEIGEGFRVTLMPPPVTPLVTPLVGKEPQLADKVLELARANPRISRQEMASTLGVGLDTIKEYLAKLRKQGRLGRDGRTSAGHWVVHE